MGGGKIVRDFARHTGVPNHRGEIMRARFGPTAKLTHHNGSVRDMLNHARLGPVQADKAKPAQNLLLAKERG